MTADSAGKGGSSIYGRWLGAGLCGGAMAALSLGILDGVRSASADTGASLVAVTMRTVGLYALVGLAVGVAVAAVMGALSAQFGANPARRMWRALNTDADLDRAGLAGVLAAIAILVVVIGIAAVLSLAFVGNVERKAVGALIAGAGVAASLPVMALLWFPAYRAARLVTGKLPSAPVPLTIAVPLIGLFGVGALGAIVIGGRLDLEALALGGMAALLAAAVITTAVALAVHAVLGRAGRGVVLGVSALSAVVLVGSSVVPFGATDQAVARAVTDGGSGSATMVHILRGLRDGDGDGFSAFFAGPDCDDSRAGVNPAAKEIPGNGLDDNCVDGDLSAAAAAPVEPKPTPPAAKAAVKFDGNVLVIVVDTLRADRLGVTGYKRDGQSLTPNLDKFADGAVRFSRAYAQAPNTPRSFPSMFFSRFPSQLAVDKQFKNYSTVLPENVSMWEVLRDNGYLTTGYSTHFYFKEERGIRQGFTTYDNEGALTIAGSNTDIASPRTVPKVSAALGELAAKGDKFAMFVHLFEPHGRYMVHEQWPVKVRGTPSLVVKYDWEIAFVDIWIGKLLEALDQHKLADNTMVVIASDHGEAFGVHRVAGKRMFFHGQTLYDELLRVPLLFRIPGVDAQVNDQPVMLLDMAPTVLSVLGIDAPDSFVGRPLTPALAGDKLAPAPAFGQLLPAPSWKHSAAMIVSEDGRYKLVNRISDRTLELFDLRVDPEERTNLAKKKSDGVPEVLDRLRQRLSRFVEVEASGG